MTSPSGVRGGWSPSSSGVSSDYSCAVGGPIASKVTMTTTSMERGHSQREWFEVGGPRTLAAVRIAAGLGALLFAYTNRAFELPPEQLRFPPGGTAWLSFLPANQPLFEAAIGVVAVAGVAVVLGWRPSWSCSVTALAVFYAGWVTTLTGKVNHSHHIMWVLVILAVSPSANTWAVRQETRRGSYHWPLMATISVIGLIYFGAGLQKLLSVGLAWGWSDNLANTMTKLAWEKGRGVHQWLIDWPLASRVLGTAALIFELTFLPLLLHPRTRRWVWPLGLVFHGGTRVILGISFLTLELLYVVFLPFDRTPDIKEPTDVQRRVIASLVAAIAVFSLLGLERVWPIAAYPGFRGIQSARIVDVEITAEGSRYFVTESPQALAVGRERILPLVSLSLDNGRQAELVEWLKADSLHLVVIDTSAGVVVERGELDISGE